MYNLGYKQERETETQRETETDRQTERERREEKIILYYTRIKI